MSKTKPSNAVMALLLSTFGLVTPVHGGGDTQYTFQVPPVSQAATPLPPSYMSLSIEFQFFPDYTGNFSQPNDFSLGLLKAFADVGDQAYIRIGGSSEDRVYYNESFPLAIQSFFDNWWESNPYNGTMGPAFFDGVGLLPADFRYVFGVNEGGFNNSAGQHDQNTTMANIARQAAAAYAAMGRDRMWAIETGNEMSGYNYSYQGVWYRDPAEQFNQTDFVRDDFNATYDLLQGPVLPGDPRADQSADPLWRAGDLSGFKSDWSFEGCWALGQNAWRRLREYSVHLYPATVCAANLAAAVTVNDTTLNHALTASTLEPNRARAAYTASQGVEFTIGECNSVSCSGKPGVSDSFSAALWAFDWAMYAASIGVKRIYYHQGPGFPYAAIWPTEINGTLPCVRSSYYGYVMGSLAAGSTAAGTSGKRVVSVINETSVSAYALYSSAAGPRWANPEWYGGRSGSGASSTTTGNCGTDAAWTLTDLAFLNLREFNQTSPQSCRGSITFALGPDWEGARVTRLTAAGADTLPVTRGTAPYLESHEEEGPMTVGCMSYESGRAVRAPGCLDEVVTDGLVTVMDSEAVLVSKTWR